MVKNKITMFSGFYIFGKPLTDLQILILREMQLWLCCSWEIVICFRAELGNIRCLTQTIYPFLSLQFMLLTLRTLGFDLAPVPPHVLWGLSDQVWHSWFRGVLGKGQTSRKDSSPLPLIPQTCSLLELFWVSACEAGGEGVEKPRGLSMWMCLATWETVLLSAVNMCLWVVQKAF